MATHSFLGFQNPAATDKREDTIALNLGGVEVHRQAQAIAGHDTAGNIASVGTALPALTDCGLSVRIVGMVAEDAGHTTADPGLQLLAVRNDNAGTLAGTDLDYAPLSLDCNGWLRVQINGNAIGLALNSTLTGGSAKAIARGATKGATPAADATVSVIDADHDALDVYIRGGAAAGGTSSTFGAAFPASGTAVGGSDGTNMVSVRVSTTTPATGLAGWVVHPKGFATPAGDSMVDDTLNSLVTSWANQLDPNNDRVSVTGIAAHDDALSSCSTLRPVLQSGQATSALSGLTLVANADMTNFMAGVDGVQIVREHTGLEDIVLGNVSNTAGTCDTLIAAQGAGVKVYITKITVTNAHATTFAYAEITSGNKVKHTIPLPAVGGATLDFDPPLAPDSANMLWGFDPSAGVTTLYCSAVGFRSKV